MRLRVPTTTEDESSPPRTPGEALKLRNFKSNARAMARLYLITPREFIFPLRAPFLIHRILTYYVPPPSLPAPLSLLPPVLFSAKNTIKNG